MLVNCDVASALREMFYEVAQMFAVGESAVYKCSKFIVVLCLADGMANVTRQLFPAMLFAVLDVSVYVFP